MTQHPTTADLRRLDKQHVWHPFTHMSLWLADDPLVITAGDGMYLIDSDGNRYLDGVSSLWCNVHGHRVPHLDDAVRAQLDKIAHSTMLGLTNEPATLLADRLMKLVPPNLKKVFYSDAGATSTEIAFKMAVQYWHNIGRPDKKEFIGFSEAYHGDTFGAMSVGRTETFHRAYFPMLFKTHFAPTPFTYRPPSGVVASATTFPTPAEVKQHCLQQLESLLQQHAPRIAAICIEPLVQGAAGMIVHPDGFLADVRRLATAYDVLLIADEVAVGFGRTGTLFACQQEHVQPDLLCVAKGITGGYLPLAATFATQQIFDAFLPPLAATQRVPGSLPQSPDLSRTFFHGHTYTGNPLACAAALASLDLFEQNDLVANVRRRSVELSRMLHDRLADLPHVGDIRQKGYMVGIELVADKPTRRPFDPKRRLGAEVCARLRRHGVILRPLADTIVLMPPPAMDLDDLGRIIEALRTEILAIRP